jgi:arylsulfatase
VGDAVNASPGSAHMRRDNYNEIDQTGLRGDGLVLAIDGKKDSFTREWGTPDAQTYEKIDLESEQRLMEFVNRNAGEKKPFFISYWPNLMSFLPPPVEQKKSYNGGTSAEALVRLDAFIGELMAELEKLGIAENTLLVVMADNGPMVHNPPSLFGMADTIFRGGKGDVTEGGVRVPAFAWWPGVIKPGTILNDMVHETDLFTTFARLGGGMENIPTDRVIDGVDQSSLLMNGDGFGRRDWVFIYTGNELGATVKGRYKRHWIGPESGEGAGTSAAFYDLITDPRETSPKLASLIYQSGQWDRMLIRHTMWKEKYPDKPKARGIPFTGIENARPETKAIAENFEILRKEFPFDPLDFIKFNMPETLKVTQRVDAVD